MKRFQLLGLLALCVSGCDDGGDDTPTSDPDAALTDGAVDTDGTPGDGAVSDAGRSDSAARDQGPDAAPSTVMLRINEVSSKDDFIELVNLGDPLEVEGFGVSDSGYDPEDPQGTAGHLITLPPLQLGTGELLLLERGDDFEFGLGAEDTVRVYDTEGRIADVVLWVEGQADPSYCRLPDGTGDMTACAATPGELNAPPVEPECGNDEIEGDEVCDGDDIGDATCADYGLGEGQVRCAADCLAYDTSGCPPLVLDTLVINEASSSGDDFIEILNGADEAIELEGWIVVDANLDPGGDGDIYVFPAGSLAPGERRVLRKGTDHTFGLGGQDGVRLFAPDGTLVDATAWLDGAAASSWCRIPDGEGEFESCTATPGAVNQPLPPAVCGDGAIERDEVCDGDNLGDATCQTQGFDMGDLGCAADCLSLDLSDCESTPRVVVNEVSAKGDDPIELYNGGAEAVDLTGWSVADDGYDLLDPEGTADHRYTLPDGELAAGAFLVLLKDQNHTFGLGSDDSVRLFDAGGALVDQVDWPDGAADPSYCRVPDGSGAFMTCAALSLGESNAR